MKKLLLLAVLIICAAVAVFFVETKPDTPLIAEIVESQVAYGGSLRIICGVTNKTAKAYVLHAGVERLSQGLWRSETLLVNGQSAYNVVGPYSSTKVAAFTSQTSGAVRVSIRYGKDKTARERQIDIWLSKFNMGPLFGIRWRERVTTAPTNFVVKPVGN